ncbi:MAG: phosphopantetheine-binding protein [Thermodesulfobacteriota bacterium]
MVQEIDQETEQDVREMIFDYFADECDVDRAELSEATNIIEELEGDSLMLLSLLELVRRQHGLTIELKVLGRYLMEKPADTLGQVVQLTLAVIRYGNDIVNVDLS